MDPFNFQSEVKHNEVVTKDTKQAQQASELNHENFQKMIRVICIWILEQVLGKNETNPKNNENWVVPNSQYH